MVDINSIAESISYLVKDPFIVGGTMGTAVGIIEYITDSDRKLPQTSSLFNKEAYLVGTPLVAGLDLYSIGLENLLDMRFIDGLNTVGAAPVRGLVSVTIFQVFRKSIYIGGYLLSSGISRLKQRKHAQGQEPNID